MFSFRTLLAAAPLLALAIAQNVAFTSVPAVVQAGNSYNITWGGGDGTGATLTLRRGNPQDLSTVDTIADSVTNFYYVWNVPQDIQSGDDYALQITQGQSNINYSGLFTVQGSSSTSNATTTAASNSTMSITSMASASGTGTAIARNSTFSTATLTSSSASNTFGDMTSTRSSSSRTGAATTESTGAPSNDAPIRTGSSAALILGIVAAVMLH